MNRNNLIAIVVGCVTFVIMVVACTVVVSRNSTERLEACVNNGGSYVRVEGSGSGMECVQKDHVDG